jgi:hypothetical protein
MKTCAGWLWLIPCAFVCQVPAGEQPPSGELEEIPAGPQELGANDFRFNGIYGSDGARISRLATNHQ